MTRSKSKYASLACWFAFVSLACVYLLAPTKGVTAANFSRIHKGTTLRQAEAIFGCRPFHSVWCSGNITYVWEGKEFNVQITFDEYDHTAIDGKILGGNQRHLDDAPLTPLDWLQNHYSLTMKWLGL